MDKQDLNSSIMISVGREEVALGWEASNENDDEKKSRGFHLSRSKWDPYPWIRSVDKNSIADLSGLRAGDCLLKVDGTDLLGLRMQDIATLISRQKEVNLEIWRNQEEEIKKCARSKCQEWEGEEVKEETSDTAVALEGPLPEVAHKLASAVSGVVKILECPICLESSTPPVSQCVHGHILCVGCRQKTEKCPVCRVRLGQGRCLLADKFYRVLQETFSLHTDSGNDRNRWSLHERLFGTRKKKEIFEGNVSKSKLISPKSKHLLSKLFPSSVYNERGASTESLPATSSAETVKSTSGSRRWFLRQLNCNDRAKSASTGELSREGVQNCVGGSLQRLERDVTARNSGAFLSVPPTPIWGGSTESVNDVQITCPLSRRTGCEEIIAVEMILEHLAASHMGPIVSFHKKKAKMPFPLLFNGEVVFVFHCREDTFFLQNEDNKFWINCTGTSGKKWKWMIRGYTKNVTEVIQLIREVQNLREHSLLSSHHLATLPEFVYQVEVEILEENFTEGIQV